MSSAHQDDPAFSSDVIDLSEVDLSDLSAVSGPVLRASLQRICRELARDVDVFAGFHNSLPPRAGQVDLNEREEGQ